MSLFAKLEQRAHPRDPALAEWWGGGPVSGAGVHVTAKSAIGVMAVWAAIRLIAETLAELPLGLFQVVDNGRRRHSSHPLDAVLHSAPNEWQTSLEWREMMQGHILLRGNAYSRLILTRGGYVEQLLPLHPDRVTPRNEALLPGGPRVRYYYYQPVDGPGEVIWPSEMFHLRGLSDDGWVGLSPLEVARETLGLAIAAEQHGARFLANNVQPGGVFEIPGRLREEAYTRLKNEIEGRKAGAAHAGKTLILEEGLKWQQIGLTNKDAQFLESRKFQVTEIARMFKVPPHMIADLDRATFTNIEHQAIEFVKYTMLPWLVRWEQRIEKDLLGPTERKSIRAKFNLSGLLRGDTASRYAAYAIGRQWGWLSADDVRELEDQNPLPDGQGRIYLVPMNMKDAGEVDEPSVESDEERAALRRRLEVAHVRLFLDAAHRILRKETSAAQRAIAQARSQQSTAPLDRFCDEFYGAEHEQLIVRTMAPVVQTTAESIASLSERPAPAAIELLAASLSAAAARRHVSKQRAEVRKALVGTWQERATALETLTNSWGERATELAGDEVASISTAVLRQLPAPSAHPQPA